MPRLDLLQTNFTAGEITPRMAGRVDVARYQNGAECVENGIPVVHGGIDRRPGLRFLAASKFADTRRCRLVRYVFNAQQAYMLELGHGYLRVFTHEGAAVLDATGLAPLELVTPYTEDQVLGLTFKQGGDTLFLYHADVPTQRVRRVSASLWTIGPVPWVTEPFAEIGHQPGARLSLSAATVGTGRTFTTAPVSAPDAPTIGVATPLNAAAAIAFTPPADTGGLPIDHYEATSAPGGIVATGIASPIVMTGLTNNVAYTFTVKAINSAGTSPASAASAPVTPRAHYPSTIISATVDPVDKVVNAYNGELRRVLGPTAAGANGVATYSYHWILLPGSSGDLTITHPDQAQPQLRSVGTNTTNYGALQCTVRDASGASVKVKANLTVRHSGERPTGTTTDTPRPGGGGDMLP